MNNRVLALSLCVAFALSMAAPSASAGGEAALMFPVGIESLGAAPGRAAEIEEGLLELHNRIDITQQGRNNSLSVEQAGMANLILLDQQGNGGLIRIVQAGSSNTALIVQR